MTAISAFCTGIVGRPIRQSFTVWDHRPTPSLPRPNDIDADQVRQDGVSEPFHGALPPVWGGKMYAQLTSGFVLSPCVDPAWLLIEEGVDPAREREIESLFAIGNEYLGTRASIAEG